MSDLIAYRVRGSLRFLLLITVSLLLSSVIAADSAGLIAGHAPEKAVRLGEAMYRNGTLPTGEAMKAIVQGDLTVDGVMASCSKCHMRSGLGSYEGNILTPPTNGSGLFSPVLKGKAFPGIGMKRGEYQYPRPAYDDASLAKMLRTGVDPAGRTLSEVMPRYLFDDSSMEIMVSYLKNLNSGFSPGVSTDGIRFATVVADSADPKDREAMLKPLTAYIQEEWNQPLPVLAKATRDGAYLPVLLDVWELKGPPPTWKDQLAAYYRQQPVFALLGGVLPGRWDPVHEFCETNRVPCIFPITDLPMVAENDWYTVYFSKGYYQEGEAAAKYTAHAAESAPDLKIVQVLRSNEQGRSLSEGFTNEWKKNGKGAITTRVLAAGESTGKDFWRGLAGSNRGALLLLWLGPDDLPGIEMLGESEEKPSMVFLSSSMLSAGYEVVPDAIRDFTYLSYPKRLPEEQGRIPLIVDQWLKVRKLSVPNNAISSRVYFLTRILAKTLIDMSGNFYRDYFLDIIDSEQDQTSTSAVYPRLSFGPGQRYASKGCYIVMLTKGQQPKIVRKSDWIIY